jgi:hypothetical protein
MRTKSRIDPDWEETDPNYRIKRSHGAALIERHNKLLAAGYRIDLARIDAGDIPFVHPNNKMPKLALWDDGLVNDMYPSHFKNRDHARTIFEPEDREGFEQFVAHVPRPKFIEKIRISTVEEAFYVILAWTILIAFGVAAGNIGEKVWDWFAQL